MTRKIRLSFGNEASSTAISNIFIDNYMAEAHGSYVKVYIYLLRCLSDPSMQISISSISDFLDETEKDIVRALRYWEKKQLLNIDYAADGEIASISIADLSNTMAGDNTVSISAPQPDFTVISDKVPAPAPASAPVRAEEPAPAPESTARITEMSFTKPSYTVSQIESFREFDEFNRLIDHIEDCFGRTLSHRDLQTPAFLFEGLGFSTELIRFLYDYCISKDKKSSAYIEKIARTWAAKQIDTPDKAKRDILTCSKEFGEVRAAFGITRALGAIELDIISRWVVEYRMTPELIREACNRTLLKTGKPDFKYADGILSRWFKASVTGLDDVATLDAGHDTLVKNRAAQTAKTSVPVSKNKFNQFPQRNYTQEDYLNFERKKLNLK